MTSSNFTQLDNFCVLQAQGADTSSFLQSQFSNDLLTHQYPFSAYGLWLDRKGKVQADSIITLRSNEEAVIFSPFTHSTTLLPLIESNIIADEVELTDITSDLQAYALWPTGSAQSLAAGPLKYQLCAPGEVPAGTEQPLEQFHNWRISSGFPIAPDDIQPSNLPQEGGLEHYGVSFSKGCYLGQEVMARLKAMGQVQRHLYQIHATDNMPLCSGSTLYREDKEVGTVRSVGTGQQANQGLAILKDRYIKKGDLITTEDDKPAYIKFLERISNMNTHSTQRDRTTTNDATPS